MRTKKIIHRKMRDLLCLSINTIIKQGELVLNVQRDEPIRKMIFTEIAGKHSRITLRFYSEGEVSVTIFWNIKEKCKGMESYLTIPLNRNKKEAVDACCTGWLKREKKVWLEGVGRESIDSTFCARSCENDLLSIADVAPLGYNKTGKRGAL